MILELNVLKNNLYIMFVYNWKSFNEAREPYNTTGLYKNVYASKSNPDIVIKTFKLYQVDKVYFEVQFSNDNPDIYAKIYKIDYKKGIMIQEKLNTDIVKKELDYLTNKLKRIGYDNDVFNIIKSLIKNPNLYYYVSYKDLSYDIIKEKFKEKEFNLFNKWFNFIKKISEIDPKKYKKYYLDFHSNNIGEDKKGNLKLLDI